MTGIAVTGYAQGTYWPALWKAAGLAGDSDDQRVWGTAFVEALSKLGLPTFGDSNLRFVGPILMHAGIPAYCLGDFFRLLLERRRQDPGLDADNFLAWATAPGRKLRLSELDKPAERFLVNGGDYAQDIVDRTFDLLDSLADPDPDFDAVRLPSYMIEKAKNELAAGHLDVSGAARSAGSRSHASTRRQAQPRIALDPYGQGVHVLLPAVGDTLDGVARWRITADGETSTVQSRAMWVGAAETTPETVFPLDRPVRSVVVSLSGRQELAVELAVVDPADPVLFFGDDGRRLSSAVSLPRSQVWIMHPIDRDLEFAGDAGHISDPAVPFGWDGWRLRHLSLEDVQSVGLHDSRLHPVEVQARPKLLLDEPVPGASTPFGSPVYSMPPQLELPQVAGADIKWYVEIRRVGGTAPLVGCTIEADDTSYIWDGVPRPVLGAFEVTVRGPLGRGLRRTVFIAEGLSITYLPQVRLLTGTGLANGKVTLAPGIGATVQPPSLRFGPSQRAHPVEYRTADESEPIIITPPHAAVMCAGAGVTTWATSVPHLVAEEFADAGRLLVRIPGQGRGSELELAVHVRGQRVQTIPATGQQPAGLAGFELSRAADTISEVSQAELTLTLNSTMMPVAVVRPRRLASGAELTDDKLVLHDAASIDGLTAGVYLTYAPWRPPVELAISADGIADLPNEIKEAGPLRILIRVDDPWIVSDWPAWLSTDAYACPATGFPKSEDQEEESLSRFVAGEGDLPQLTHHLGWLWRLVDLAPELVKDGAPADLADRCTAELRKTPRAALLSLRDAELSSADVVHAVIATGVAAAPLEKTSWTTGEERTLERLWAAFPAAAAIATGDLFGDDDAMDAAIAQCGDSLTEILKGHDDPYAGVGRFGKDAEHMAVLHPEQIEAMWQAAAVVPQATLDADTRATAARRMFDSRNTASARAAAVFVRTITNAAELLIRQSLNPNLANAIRARRPDAGKGGWFGLPAMSIAMALLARLAARGDSKATMLENEYRSKWANIAVHAPDLIAIDLILAEALVAATVFADNLDIPEDPE